MLKLVNFEKQLYVFLQRKMNAQPRRRILAMAEVKLRHAQCLMVRCIVVVRLVTPSTPQNTV